MDVVTCTDEDEDGDTVLTEAIINCDNGDTLTITVEELYQLHGILSAIVAHLRTKEELTSPDGRTIN